MEDDAGAATNDHQDAVISGVQATERADRDQAKSSSLETSNDATKPPPPFFHLDVRRTALSDMKSCTSSRASWSRRATRSFDSCMSLFNRSTRTSRRALNARASFNSCGSCGKRRRGDSLPGTLGSLD